ATATAEFTPTATATATFTPIPTATATATATDTPTPTPTPICQYVVTSTTGVIVPGTVDTGNHGDDVTTTIALPFPVTFYDQTFTNITISSNGNLQFTSNNTAPTSVCLPTASMTDLIAAFWNNFYDADSASGQGVFTSISGTAPHRVF